MVKAALCPEARRSLMARFRGKDSKPEMVVRSLIHRNGGRFRLHRRDLPGTPDIVLPRRRIAIFVHGCFWHHHEGCAVAKVPSSRPAFWREKFRRNKERDETSRNALHALGWRVVTIWECETRQSNIEERLRSLGVYGKQHHISHPDGRRR